MLSPSIIKQITISVDSKKVDLYNTIANIKSSVAESVSALMLFIDIRVAWVRIPAQMQKENWSNQDPSAMVIFDHVGLYPQKNNNVQLVTFTLQ